MRAVVLLLLASFPHTGAAPHLWQASCRCRHFQAAVVGVCYYGRLLLDPFHSRVHPYPRRHPDVRVYTGDFLVAHHPPHSSVYDEVWKGWVLVAFFFIDAWLLGLSLQRMGYGVLNVGIRVRAALITAVSRKCYSMASMTKETNAQAVAFVANDINKIFEGIQEIHYLWTAPFEAAAIIILLSTLVGIYCLPGALLCFAVCPSTTTFKHSAGADLLGRPRPVLLWVQDHQEQDAQLP